MEERVAQIMTPTSQTGKTNSSFHGFTLIELTLVLSIITVLSLMIIPSLQGFYKGLVTRCATRELISLINYTRSKAINTKKIYRLNIDPIGSCSLSIEDSIESLSYKTSLPTQIKRRIFLQEGMTIQVLTHSIIFYPTGRIDGGPIYLKDERDKVYEITISQTGNITVR